MFRKLLPALLMTLAPWAMAEGGHEHHAIKGEKIGKVSFPISCGAESQKAFNRGMAMLHSFWFEKANETFSQLATTDPDCAMGHWGVAMSYYHPLWAPPTGEELAKGATAVKMAKVAKKSSARERRYVEAIAQFYADAEKLDHRSRARNYEVAMGALHAAYPQDDEARILYALALDSTADPKDKSFQQQKQCGELLEPIVQRYPEHPGLAHYVIHCYDNPVLASKGLRAARMYAKIAPAVPHALHMPSHIFTRLGLWDEAIASNAASAQAGRQFERETKMNGMWDQTAHALDYEHYALFQQGRISEAQQIKDEMAGRSQANLDISASGYGFANVRARHAVAMLDWKTAANLSVQRSKNYDADAIIYLARALGQANLGDFVAADNEVAELRRIEAALAKQPYWSGQAEIKRLQAAGWLAQARGDLAAGERLLREAAAKEDATDKNPVTPGSLIPAHELLGDLLAKGNNHRAALAEYEQALKITPGRFHALYGAASAAASAGERETARRYYSELLRVAAKGDDSAELQAAKQFLSLEQVATR